jgi:hypothetical protein
VEPFHYYVIVGLLIAVVLIVFLVRQRGTRQRTDTQVEALGAKARIRTSVDPEMERIKAGRDVKNIAGVSDPGRMADVEAGRDVIRDTTRRDPKA